MPTSPCPTPRRLEALLNEKEVAKILGWTVFTLQQRRFRGAEPRYLKIGRSVRYRPEDIEQFLESCKVKLPGEVA